MCTGPALRSLTSLTLPGITSPNDLGLRCNVMHWKALFKLNLLICPFVDIGLLQLLLSVFSSVAPVQALGQVQHSHPPPNIPFLEPWAISESAKPHYNLCRRVAFPNKAMCSLACEPTCIHHMNCVPRSFCYILTCRCRGVAHGWHMWSKP